MKDFLLTVCMFVIFCETTIAQPKREDIYSEFVLYQKRIVLEKDLRERLIGKTFSMPLDSNTEYKFETACDAISQFLFADDAVKKGFSKLFARYDSLEYDTRKSLLEAVYAVFPKEYMQHMQGVEEKENDPLLFAMATAYLLRNDTSTDYSNYLKIRMDEKFPGYDTIPLLGELQQYLETHTKQVTGKTPDIISLFRYQKKSGQKIIYSFQRWNRNYPGLAIVQNADGSFVKDANGKLLVFEQLARSGSDLPYFIRNGSTPQGIYSITGTDVSHNNFIGPTPNIQLVMPFESKWEKYFRDQWNYSHDSLYLYHELLPENWRRYEPMMEAWNAGKIGRTEIIAHGTALDPEYFKDKPFYPLTPTEGCLCAKEIWNVTSGRLDISEQFNLISAFLSTPGNKGYLYVINLDNQQKAVAREEVEMPVKKFDQSK
ncbi:MAG: hypothetical protein ABUT20_42345 [Bacteroidota bacterium]